MISKSRKKISDAPPSIKELPCMRTPRRDHQTSRAHNNANYTKWEEKKQLLEHWRSVCAPYLFLIAFSGSKPPAWVKRCASRRPNDEFLDTNLIYGLALTRKVISTGDEVAHPPLPFTTKQQLPATTSLTISRFWTDWALHMQEGGTFRCSFCLEPACPFKIEGSLWCFVNPMLNHFLPNLNILFLLCCFDK